MVQDGVTLSIRPRGKPVKRLPEEVTVPSTAPTSELYKELALKSGTSIHRLRVTKGSDGALVPNSKGLRVNATGLREQSTIYVKDLGPQIAARTVYLVEYLGPLIIHPIFYAYQVLISNTNDGPSSLQALSLILVMLHFAKRELETLFVHRFNTATVMPAFNIIRNSAYYWVLSGVNMAFWIYRPDAPAAGKDNLLITSAGLALFAVGELGNLSNHITLRNLRSAGGSERGIPQGLGFNLVTCPNYMFEAIAWAGIAIVTRSLSTVLFALVALLPMGKWAKKKEARYRKDFGGSYKKKRYYMLPGIW
ncbi:MAG: hypothetical protein Q9163_000314 [Psora crenata]